MRSTFQRAMTLALFASSCLAFTTWAADDEKKAETKPEQEVQAEKDRYAVPDGDVQELLKFIDMIRTFRPTTADEFLEHRKKAAEALQAAAAKVMELETDKKSDAARTAQSILLSFKIQELGRMGRPDQAALYGEIKDYLAGSENLSRNELGLAFTTASTIERTGNTELAINAYRTFGEIFQSQKDESLANYGEKMLGASRRLNLLGNEMEVRGETLKGEPLNWSDYRGKVVLVDFWATWCGPCIAELPNVKKHYEQYHDKGFEVVGISLDTDRDRLEKFIEERELPWVTLFQDGAAWEHPVAAYYGVMAIPTVILVDQEGKVISLNARGAELGRQLEKLLGPPPAEDKSE